MGAAPAQAGPFAELLLRHRTGAGLGQQELARQSGLSERAIRDLERGIRTPRSNSARLVAAALALTGDDLTAFLAAARPDITGTRAGAGPATPMSPVPQGDLVGRDEELRALLDLVVGARHRLVTVIGQAGLGKARAVAAICRRVEHLPLAIELAAARVRLLHPVELAGRLDRQLQMLTGGARDLPVRHQSLRAAIESSLEVVSPDSRTLFRWLGAFAGGGRLDDVEAVATTLDRDRDWLLATLTELVDINLVRVKAEGTTSRYTLPDTMAELAAEQLRVAADRHRIARAVAVHFLARVRGSDGGSGPAIDDRDADNVRSAVGWAVAHEPGLIDSAAAGALARFYEATGRLVEGQEILGRLAATGLTFAWARAGQLAALRGDLATATELGTRGLLAAAETDHAVRAIALNLLAQAAIEQGDSDTGRACLRAALVEARRSKDLALLGRVLNNLAAVSIADGRPRHAEWQMLAALQAKRRCGAGPVELGRTLYNLSEIALELGNIEMAVVRAGEAVPLLLADGFRRLAALAESAAALALLRRDGPAEALAAVERATQLLEGDGDDRRTAAVVRLRCSVVQHAAGERAAARETLRSALPSALDHTTRDRDQVADALQAHARYLVRRDPTAAADMLGVGERMRRRPVPAHIRPLRDHAWAIARQVLGERRFDERLRAGGALDRHGLLELCDRL